MRAHLHLSRLEGDATAALHWSASPSPGLLALLLLLDLLPLRGVVAPRTGAVLALEVLRLLHLQGQVNKRVFGAA